MAAAIQIAHGVAIGEDEIEETFIRASGPGGQNVNKVSTAVQLRFDVRHAPGIPEAVRLRLEQLAGGRMTLAGVLVLTARSHRSQERNRQAARETLLDLIRRASVAPRPRRATKPTLGSRLRRLGAKRERALVKQGRATPTES